MEQGALCAVSEEDLGDVPYSYIKVASCEQALKDIAEHYRRSLDIKSCRHFGKRRKKRAQKK